MKFCVGFGLFICIHIAMVSCKIRIVDLSHLHNSKSIMWPFYPAYNFTIAQRGPYESIKWLEHNTFFQTEHMGTHIDAPAHFGKGSWRTQHIPIERLMGPGVIINIKDKAAKNYDYRISLEDIEEYEKKYGRIPEGAVVLMYAGWYHKYPNKTAIFNTVQHSKPEFFHFPGFHADAVQWLINYRHISAVGGDTPSFDAGFDHTFPVHEIIGAENVIGIENAAYLDRIPEAGSTIFIPVIKIDDGSGGPTRLLATYDDGVGTPGNSAENTVSRLFTFITMICAYFFRSLL